MSFELLDIMEKAHEICYERHCKYCPKARECHENCTENECADYCNIESTLMKE